jgi:hypothetical protein
MSETTTQATWFNLSSSALDEITDTNALTHLPIRFYRTSLP